MYKHKTLLQYENKNKKLSLKQINSKSFQKDAKSKDFTAKQLTTEFEQYNTCWLLDFNDLVLDIDKRNGGLESYQILKLNYNCNTLSPSVKTPSGGFHIYFTIPPKYLNNIMDMDEESKKEKLKKDIKRKLKKNLDLEGYEGIEVKSYGDDVMIPPSTIDNHPYTFANEQGFTQHEAPEWLMDLIWKDDKKPEMISLKKAYNDSVEYQEKTKEEVRTMLTKFTGNKWKTFKNWVEMGQMLYEWDKEEGKELWEEWSRTFEDKYADGCCEHWSTFSSGDEKPKEYKKTFASLVWEYKRIIDKEHKELVGKEQTYLMSKMNDENFNAEDIEVVYNSIITSPINLITQIKFISKLVQKVRSIDSFSDHELLERMVLKLDTDAPFWVKENVLLNDAKFLNVNTLTKRAKYNMERDMDKWGQETVPLKPNGKRAVSLEKHIGDHDGVEEIDDTVWYPISKSRLLFFDGYLYCNEFKSNRLPEVAEGYTEGGLKTIDRIEFHIKMICNDNEEYAKILTQWFAFQVQHRGKLVRWCPVIQGIRGIGKSYFVTLLQSLLCDTSKNPRSKGNASNIGLVKSDELLSDFSGYSTGKLVNVFEEFDINGYDKKSTIEEVKAVITDDLIKYTRKNKDAIETPNYTNYIAFTNQKTCIPEYELERRWWIIFNKLETKEDIETKVAMDLSKYYSELHDWTKEYNSEVLKYFTDYEITDEFMSYNIAPSTIYKEELQTMYKENTQGICDIEFLLKEGGYMFNENVFCSTSLFEAYEEMTKDRLNNRQKGKLIKQLSELYTSRRMRFNGKSRNMYFLKKYNIDDLPTSEEKNKKIIELYKDGKSEMEQRRMSIIDYQENKQFNFNI
ncbi:hypothetical protein AB832_07225 [Flavobacteriaceae bacterium (ex Bugula neritina AB1)]|nr:hypothetical protein AB832_07225 [Flavobacteriaceae bacterium (ex Bugula neritina AB1)]